MPGVLKLDYLGLTEADMDTEFFTGGLAGTGNERMKLRDILALLKTIYCGKIGAEFAHISRARERLWLRKRFEQRVAADALSDEERIWILEHLTSAEGIERYLHTRYVGQKRFSLEGGESLIPLLDDLIQQGGAGGHPRNRHRHGASRPYQRAGQHSRQIAGRTVRRIRRQVRPGGAQGLR